MLQKNGSIYRVRLDPIDRLSCHCGLKKKKRQSRQALFRTVDIPTRVIHVNHRKPVEACIWGGGVVLCRTASSLQSMVRTKKKNNNTCYSYYSSNHILKLNVETLAQEFLHTAFWNMCHFGNCDVRNQSQEQQRQRPRTQSISVRCMDSPITTLNLSEVKRPGVAVDRYPPRKVPVSSGRLHNGVGMGFGGRSRRAQWASLPWRRRGERKGARFFR